MPLSNHSQSFLSDKPKLRISWYQVSPYPSQLRSSSDILPIPVHFPHLPAVSVPGFLSRISPVLILGDLHICVDDPSNTLPLGSLTSPCPLTLSSTQFSSLTNNHSLLIGAVHSLSNHQSLFSGHHTFQYPDTCKSSVPWDLLSSYHLTPLMFSLCSLSCLNSTINPYIYTLYIL